MGLQTIDGNWNEVIKMEKERVIDDIVQAISRENPDLFTQTDNTRQYDSLYPVVQSAVISSPQIPAQEKEKYIEILMGQAVGYGPLKPFFMGQIQGPKGLIDSIDITEVMVNPNPLGRPRVFYGWHGRQWYAGDHFFEDHNEVKNYIQKVCEDAGRGFNEENSIVDAWLKDGSRLAAFGFKVSPMGPAFTIRKSPLVRPAMPLAKLVDNGMFPPIIADMFKDLLVDGHANFGAFGRTDSGKTTVIRACGDLFDPDERVMIGETSFELSFPHLPNCLNLVEVGFGDQKIISMGDINNTMLRNNPDRSVVGEIRAGEIVSASEVAEVTPGGFITSGHAGGVRELRSRFPKMYARGGMELKYEHVDDQISTMFHFLVFFGKPGDGIRTMTELIEVKPDGVYEPIITLDYAEYAAKKERRWIYNSPISGERLDRLAFGGATIRPEYEKVHEKYLYPAKKGMMN